MVPFQDGVRDPLAQGTQVEEKKERLHLQMKKILFYKIPENKNMEKFI